MAAGRSIDPSGAPGLGASEAVAGVRVRSLSKTFDLPHSRYVSAKERAIGAVLFRRISPKAPEYV